MIRVLTTTCMLMFFAAIQASAGPLDRDPGPRYNPAADNMLRVPGVVGYHLHSGLAILQQSGLTPHVKTIRSVKKKYKGREGTIVDQTPSGGGVAMLGSSVTVVHYDPNMPEPASNTVQTSPNWGGPSSVGGVMPSHSDTGSPTSSGSSGAGTPTWGAQSESGGTWTGPTQTSTPSETSASAPLPPESEGADTAPEDPQGSFSAPPVLSQVDPTSDSSQSTPAPKIPSPTGQVNAHIPSFSGQGKRPSAAVGQTQAGEQTSSETGARPAKKGKGRVHGALGNQASAAAPDKGRYRIILTGFTANRQTVDDPLQLDGKGDEIRILCNLARTDFNGNLKERLTLTSAEYGDTNRQSSSRIRAGSASAKGGIITGDHYPRQSPWTLQGNPSFDRLPFLVWEGELTAGRDVLFISPSVWEGDRDPQYITSWEQRWMQHWDSDIRSRFNTVVDEERNSACQVRDTRGIVLRYANRTDRPVGMGQRPGVNLDDEYGIDIGEEIFFPKMLVLVKERIDRLLNTNCGKGKGTVPINFKDHFSGGDGNYTVYIKLERAE
ncbi:MAG: hypothetical protein ACOC0U_07490, partial [Desulfovibrionales bacterium]